MKRKGKAIVKSVIINLVLVGTLIGGISAYTDQKFAEYSSDDKIAFYASVLDCDTSYLKRHNGNVVRMRHNDTEPIYVAIDPSYSKEDREAAIIALDEVFGIIGKINNIFTIKIPVLYCVF